MVAKASLIVGRPHVTYNTSRDNRSPQCSFWKLVNFSRRGGSIAWACPYSRTRAGQRCQISERRISLSTMGYRVDICLCTNNDVAVSRSSSTGEKGEKKEKKNRSQRWTNGIHVTNLVVESGKSNSLDKSVCWEEIWMDRGV